MNEITLIEGNYEDAVISYSMEIDRAFFEFCLSYTDPHAAFGEIDRFLWESRHIMTRFKNRYEGPVLFDLTAYNDRPAHEIGDHFHAFMFFLRGNTGYDVTFTVGGKCSDSLREALERHFSLRTVTLDAMPKKSAERPIGFSADRAHREV